MIDPDLEYAADHEEPVGEIPGRSPADFADELIAQTLAHEVAQVKASSERIRKIALANSNTALARQALAAVNAAARMEAAL